MHQDYIALHKRMADWVFIKSIRNVFIHTNLLQALYKLVVVKVSSKSKGAVAPCPFCTFGTAPSFRRF
jgi:hypothetical protein